MLPQQRQSSVRSSDISVGIRLLGRLIVGLGIAGLFSIGYYAFSAFADVYLQSHEISASLMLSRLVGVLGGILLALPLEILAVIDVGRWIVRKRRTKGL